MIQRLFQLFAPRYEENPTRKKALYVGFSGLSEQGLPWEAGYLIRCDPIFLGRVINALRHKGVEKVELFWA